MVSPIDGVLAIHNAFRADMAAIDAAALAAARGGPELGAMVGRFDFFHEILTYHGHGEEAGVFPILEEVAPLVAESYEMDHRGLDRAFEALSHAVSVRDALETARSTSALKFHLDSHLAEEDAHMYRIVRERVSMPDQIKAVGTMAFSMPADRAPEFIAWVYPLLGDDDRENFTRVTQMLMTPETFAPSIPLIHQAIGDGFAELTRRIPELAA